MIITTWRIVRPKYASAALSSAKYGGRWNSKGTYVAYTSGTESLAALETLVHHIQLPKMDYVIISIEFDANLAQEVALEDLSPSWMMEPPGPASMHVGDEWVRKTASPVLSVPSVLIKSERNYLINPQHRHFSRLKVNAPQPFSFDPRLLWQATPSG